MENQTIKNKKGLSGIESILTGFVIIGVILTLLVLLVYVFGSVTTSLESTAVSNTVTNESGAYLNDTGYTLSGTSSEGYPRTYVITAVWANVTDDVPYLVPSTNYTVSSTGVLTNATHAPNATQYANSNVSYTYLNDSTSQTASRDAQTNTSRALPLVGILFIIIAIGALITILIVSLMGKRKS